MASIVNTTRFGLSIPIGAAGGAPLNSSIFGDGRDGKVTIAANETRTIEIVEDCQIAELNCVSLDIAATAKLTTSGRCPALIIKVQNDCTIHGTIDMDKKAPLESTNEAELAMHPVITLCGSPIGGSGGAGGPHLSHSGYSDTPTATRNGGTGGKGHVFGGGYGGGGAGYSGVGGSSDERPSVGIYWPYPGGYSGVNVNNANGAFGSGGGSKLWEATGTAPGGDAPGGSGATFRHYSDSDATSDTPVAGSAGYAYGGGVIYLIVGGNLTIGSGGLLTANGGDGGPSVEGSRNTHEGGYVYSFNTYSGSGGGGGGGVVCIVHRGTLVQGGTISVEGGFAGTGKTVTYWPDGAPSQRSASSKGADGSIGTTFIRSFDSLVND